VNPRRRWRGYRIVTGGRPVKEYLDALTDDETGCFSNPLDLNCRGLAYLPKQLTPTSVTRKVREVPGG